MNNFEKRLEKITASLEAKKDNIYEAHAKKARKLVLPKVKQLQKICPEFKCLYFGNGGHWYAGNDIVVIRRKYGDTKTIHFSKLCDINSACNSVEEDEWKTANPRALKLIEQIDEILERVGYEDSRLFDSLEDFYVWSDGTIHNEHE